MADPKERMFGNRLWDLGYSGGSREVYFGYEKRES